MSNFCKRCQNYVWLSAECCCKPFKVLDLDCGDDEPETFYSRHDEPRRIAEDYAERYYTDRDYPTEWSLEVEGEKFHVIVEQEPVFWASKIKGDTCQ